LKVLIVDDSLLAGHALKSYFVKLGHEVLGLARDGQKGKEMYLSDLPDLITVDAIMPEVSGVELIQYINKMDAQNNRSTKILMISSDIISQEEKNTLKVSKYLVKPITFAKIEAALQSL